MPYVKGLCNVLSVGAKMYHKNSDARMECKDLERIGIGLPWILLQATASNGFYGRRLNQD